MKLCTCKIYSLIVERNGKHTHVRIEKLPGELKSLKFVAGADGIGKLKLVASNIEGVGSFDVSDFTQQIVD